MIPEGFNTTNHWNTISYHESNSYSENTLHSKLVGHGAHRGNTRGTEAYQIPNTKSLLSGELWSTINHGGHGEHSESRFRDKICYVEQDLMRILRCVRSVRCGILTHRYISTTASKSKSLQKKIKQSPSKCKSHRCRAGQRF